MQVLRRLASEMVPVGPFLSRGNYPSKIWLARGPRVELTPEYPKVRPGVAARIHATLIRCQKKIEQE